MDERQPSGPYRPLGKQLKALRDKANETLAETSGSVEIDVKQLASYELGHNRPTEDVLLLLISHFSAHDDEAVRLWELAGYGLTKAPSVHRTSKMAKDTKSPSETQVLFTDVVDVIVNNYGVVMNFMQSSEPNAKPSSVAKVGMSREHAKSVLQILQVTLAQTERSLPKLPKRLTAQDNASADEQPLN